MEREFASPAGQPDDSLAPATLYFCLLCDKPFTTENSRDRHRRYCGSRTRNRPRSCRACNASKTKCSFDTPCSRCITKHIECVYDSVGAVRRRATHKASTVPDKISDSIPTTAPHVDKGTLRDVSFDFIADPAPNNHQTEASGNGSSPSSHLSRHVSLDDPLAFEGLFAFDEYCLGLSDGSMSAYSKTTQQAPSWCSWTIQGIDLSVVAQNSLVKGNSHLLAELQRERPHAQRGADLIIQSLRSLPTMMLRRETFPWFIHRHSHLLSKPASAALPEALSTCMSIAQMFASRTAETSNFLWRTIRAECRNFVAEKMYNMSKVELLSALQACMIYLIMFIVDYSADNESNGSQLAKDMHDLYLLFKQTAGRSPCQSGLSRPESCWEDWIFAESQVRLTNLWLLVGCVICVKAGAPLDASQSYRTLFLPCPKSLWEASTHSEWELEYEPSWVSRGCGLVTLGDLLDVQQFQHTASNARKLDKWNAGIDNLGFLLNLVPTMV